MLEMPQVRIELELEKQYRKDRQAYKAAAALESGCAFSATFSPLKREI